MRAPVLQTMLFASDPPAATRMNASPVWQTVFISFALVLILFEMVRGWRLGLVRQGVRLLALAAAYATGIFAGPILLPLLRPFLRLPDLIISVLGGAVLALIVYAAISTLGAILFKRTGEQRIGLIRFFYGASGAVLGIFFGLFSVWLIVVAIRSLGAVANAETHLAHRPGISTTHLQAASDQPPALLQSLASLKDSIELGSLGEAVRATDIIPAQTYQALGKLGTVSADPRRLERFLTFPGATALTQNPRITALRDDPEITRLIEEQRYLELMQNPKLIAALNDPALIAQLKKFDLQKALDYALQR